MSDNLAIFGGPKVITEDFKLYNSYGPEEVQAAKEVIESGVLSKFLGAWHDDFYGGEKVREFEDSWKNFFKVNHAISVNSATSGLIAAVGALDIEPGDEVIVSPWTMCASAISILVWNAIPVFADIDIETFNIAPDSIEKNITPRTKAIMVPDIFGHAADLSAIMDIAKKYNLKVIEDAAQSPNAMFGDKYVGTVADIGVFSLNYHKHIHTGEGGVCVTNDPVLAERMQLIRNHAEAVVAGKKVNLLNNMVGFNFRMGEIEAAMGIEQLKKLKTFTNIKSDAAVELSSGISKLKGLKVPIEKEGCSHVYYIYGLKLDTDLLHIDRKTIVDALKAEGVPALNEGYVNVHQLPIYQKKIAYGSKGFPWSLNGMNSEVSYEKGICPVAEKLHDSTMFGINFCMYDFNVENVNLIIKAFHKVWGMLDSLKK